MAALASAVGADVAKIGQGKAFKANWIGKNAQNELYRAVPQINDEAQTLLTALAHNEKEKVSKDQLGDLKKRKWTTTTY